MTTRLNGDSTYFLPFNRGANGGKGNPSNPDGYATAYFWEEILQRDNWLRILGSFMQFEKKENTSASGKKTTTEKNLLFPRYHQWDAVTKLIEAARYEGAGHTYLFQHSAGSGKSNTIGWCAHQLSTLHDDKDKKVFDSVIVITDRTVLDAQLKETISQFESTPGVVATIDSKQGSKSGKLAAALKNGAMIIVVTLQTFPFVMNEIRQSSGLSGKKFAVIIDEAHSSQSGSAARHLRGVLSSEGAKLDTSGDASGDTDEETEVTAEDLLLKEAETRKLPPNASFLAFTATPKAKTMEVFGRPPDTSLPKSKTNLPQAFHVYTMRQAIDEGFILDVLQNFTPYRVAYKLAHNGSDWEYNVVEKSEGMKAIARWVRLHPYNIAQKVEIIVEHFRHTIAYRLGGKAKAMVVTNSRQEAVRYKIAMDKYIKDSGYSNLATLVAFSGDVLDPETGPDKFNENTMNTKLHGQDIRQAFATDDYHVLIVANKFQTGFDQPLLVAMYVDKRIDGITAVQTLSRLNRTYPGKDSAFVLDFVNDAETIRKAFEPYYECAELLATTNPNLIYDLQNKLSAELIFTDQEALTVAEIILQSQKYAQKTLIAALNAPVDRFKKRWTAAEQAKDKAELDKLTIFHKNLGSFCRLYDFLSQIVHYEDMSLERDYIFFKHLEPLVRPDRIRQQIDLSDITLSHYRIIAGDGVSVSLGTVNDVEKGLSPIEAVGTKVAHDPEKVKIAEIIEKLNELFDDGSLSDADKVGLFNHIAEKMMENEDINTQAKANTREQFKHSPKISDVLTDSLIAALDSYKSMGNKVLQDKSAMNRLQSLLVDYVYDRINTTSPE
jgi:type I restriction enzyme R subunit